MLTIFLLVVSVVVVEHFNLLRMKMCDLFYHVQHFCAIVMHYVGLWRVITIISRGLSRPILGTWTLSTFGKGCSDKCQQKHSGGPCVSSGMASSGDITMRQIRRCSSCWQPVWDSLWTSSTSSPVLESLLLACVGVPRMLSPSSSHVT